MHRTIAAFLAAALVPALCWVVASWLVDGRNPAGGLLLLPVVWPVCFVAGLIPGYPLFWLARRAGLVRWWTAMIAGLPVGAVLPFLLTSNIGWTNAIVLPAWAWGIAGSAAGLLFWIVLERQARQIPDPGHGALSRDRQV